MWKNMDPCSPPDILLLTTFSASCGACSVLLQCLPPWSHPSHLQVVSNRGASLNQLSTTHHSLRRLSRTEENAESLVVRTSGSVVAKFLFVVSLELPFTSGTDEGGNCINLFAVTVWEASLRKRLFSAWVTDWWRRLYWIVYLKVRKTPQWNNRGGLNISARRQRIRSRCGDEFTESLFQVLANGFSGLPLCRLLFQTVAAFMNLQREQINKICQMVSQCKAV